MSRIFIAIAVMALTTYIIRMVPFAFVRKKIKNRFIQSVLYYIPYAVLSAMTIPSIFYATQDLPSAIAGTVVAVVLAYFGCPLIVVALSASAAAYLAMLLLPLILQ
ncbi:MAG: AzlD domain-containing protein [Oscillospiraceae bacterium]|nr:AzlD domain-containing protein [Oscillospiraceae bacterium]MBR5363459.1 AzlD domain-containing protein [Oscillospiraceae bacterium]